MGDEASIAIIASMQDEASPEMENLGHTTAKTQESMVSMQMTLMATGSALNAVGSVLRQIDSPAAKTAATFLSISGAVMTSAVAIGRLVPIISSATKAIWGMVAAQTAAHALAGPPGWVMLGIGAGVGVGATAGIMHARRPREVEPAVAAAVQQAPAMARVAPESQPPIISNMAAHAEPTYVPSPASPGLREPRDREAVTVMAAASPRQMAVPHETIAPPSPREPIPPAVVTMAAASPRQMAHEPAPVHRPRETQPVVVTMATRERAPVPTPVAAMATRERAPVMPSTPIPQPTPTVSRTQETKIVQNFNIQGSVVTEKELSNIVRKNTIKTQQANAGRSGIE